MSSATSGGTGDDWVNTEAEFLYIINGSGGNITVTKDIESTVDGQAVTDRTAVVDAGTTEMIGPFPTAVYNDSSTGRANVTYSGITSLTVAIISLTKVA